MPLTLKTAMTKAADLTRARKLIDATRTIQDMLSGVLPPGAARAGTQQPPQGPGGYNPPAIDLKSSEFRPGRGAADAASAPPAAKPAFSRQPWTLPDGASARAKSPLADVLQTLARARRERAGSPPGALRGAPDVPQGASFVTRSFSNAAGARSYRLYVPARKGETPPPLIVMLHGCTQDPDDFAVGTGMNALAEAHGFLVAYPEQPRTANQMGCWNWFEPKDQRREAGEPSIIAGITREVIRDFGADPRRIFVAGLSAGGAMAVVMGTAYPDLYDAVGVHSGLAYAAAADVSGAFMAMRGDAHNGMLRSARREPASAKNPVRTIIFHGDADQTVHPSNAEQIVAALSPDSENGRRVTQAGVASGRAYARTIISGATGTPVGEHWVVEGAGHAWSGGDPAGTYTDPRGPAASREMVRFFLGLHP